VRRGRRLHRLMVSYSGLGKTRRDPLPVRVVHETVGVPLKYFPLLAACEFAGALGLLVGIWWPPIGVVAGIGSSTSWEPSCPICVSAISKAFVTINVTQEASVDHNSS
jgi:hypothetical protein